MDSQKLKSLQVRRAQIEKELAELGSTLRDMKRNADRLQSTLLQVEQEIKTFTDSKPIVTEHALLRYLERVEKVDLKKIENEILSPENVATISKISSGKVPFRGDLVLVVKNKTVVTINPK